MDSPQHNKLYRSRLTLADSGLISILTLLAFAVQGYHPGAEDAEIYLPGVLKALNPRLFPANSEFFAAHAHLSWFSNLIAASVRVSHLPLDAVLILWQFASIFLLLAACWKLSGLCFPERSARWAGVALVGALLTLPVAGTALYVMDQYVNPRNLAAFAGIFAVADILEHKYLWCIFWIAFAASVHPLMACFVASFCALLFVMERREDGLLFSALPFGKWLMPPESAAYHQAALEHPFHYIMKWAWYEWVGIAAPIPILWWFGKLARRDGRDILARLCYGLVIYDVIYWAAACIVSIPPQFEALARLQPLRSLHLLYILLILVGGGFIGEYWLKSRVWRWLVLFVPLGAGLFVAQRQLFPASEHIEWTRAASKNPWALAFTWAREHTPEDALFALDPRYSHIAGEDTQGFRAIAERSMLADAGKDSGAVSMFPAMADEWQAQVEARRGWAHFQLNDFHRVHDQYQVSWVIVAQPGAAELNCPYQNSIVRICRIN